MIGRPSVRQRDEMAAYLHSLGVVRANSNCHRLARDIGHWNAVFVCSDGYIRSVKLPDDREARPHHPHETLRHRIRDY